VRGFGCAIEVAQASRQELPLERARHWSAADGRPSHDRSGRFRLGGGQGAVADDGLDFKAMNVFGRTSELGVWFFEEN
jgi:hypothetical protein